MKKWAKPEIKVIAVVKVTQNGTKNGTESTFKPLRQPPVVSS
jgi:hypothetical protein